MKALIYLYKTDDWESADNTLPIQQWFLAYVISIKKDVVEFNLWEEREDPLHWEGSIDRSNPWALECILL